MPTCGALRGNGAPASGLAAVRRASAPAARIRANYADYANGVNREWGCLESFFRNLLLGENNELKSCHLLIGSEREMPVFKNGCQKKVVRKGCQKTAERVLSMLKEDQNLTQAGLAVSLGVSRQAIQKHLTGLRKAGLLRRVGPDKGGHWEVVGA